MIHISTALMLSAQVTKPSSQRQDLRDSILSALAALSENDLQTLAIQIEALATARALAS